MDVSKSYDRVMLLFMTLTLKTLKDNFWQCSNQKSFKSLKEIKLKLSILCSSKQQVCYTVILTQATMIMLYETFHKVLSTRAHGL